MVTGQPGSGKTTLVRRVAEVLVARGVAMRGFYTEEVLGASGARAGFDVVTIPDGRRGVLSRKSGLPAHYPRTGAYAVDVASFEGLALPTLSPPPPSVAARRSVVVIDEIGRMELHSAAFQTAVRRLLASQAEAVVLGALTAPIYGHRVPFCDAIAAHDRVSVERITQKTRDGVREALQRQLLLEVGLRGKG